METNKDKIDGVSCPFCGQTIKGEIPEGLKLKNIAELISKLTLEEKKVLETQNEKERQNSH